MDFIGKDNNHTRYNTEDLNEIFDALHGEQITYVGRSGYVYRPNSGGSSQTKTIKSPCVSVKALYGECMGKGRQSRGHADSSGDIVYLTEETLKLRTPTALVGYEAYQLCMLGSLGQEQAVAPNMFVKGIVETVITSCLGHIWAEPSAKQNIANQSAELATRISQEHQLRIMDNIECPPGARRRLSKEQKLARLLTDSFYGDGGCLEGPGWAWASGQRCPTGKWAYRIEAAQEYYERELAARNKYVKQIKELGGVPKPYETFPEYLHRLANAMEEGRRCYLEGES
jgi:hypothetical protein